MSKTKIMSVYEFGSKSVQKFRAKVQAFELKTFIYDLGWYALNYGGTASFTKHWR